MTRACVRLRPWRTVRIRAARLESAPVGPCTFSHVETADPIAELAHDLRSPLTSLLMLSEALLNGASEADSECRRHRLALVYGSALGLTELLADVTDRPDVGADQIQRTPAPFCIDQVLGSVAALVRPLAESKGLTVQVRHPFDARDHHVGHRAALRRTLLNLTANAVKFTDDGLVEIAAKPLEDGRVSISVHDSGGGLSPGVIEALAQPVGGSPAGDRNPFGVARLGLAICRKLVRSMGSELEVETWPGLGTRFHFALALPPAHAS